MIARICVLLGLLLIVGSLPASGGEALQIGQAASDFTLEEVNGKGIRLSEAHGARGTVIVFWATWSPRSHEALSDLQALYDEHGLSGDLQVVAVNVEHETWGPGEYEGVSRFAKASELSFPIVVDKDLTVYQEYGVTVAPFLVLTDPQGKVVSTLPGYPHTLRGEFYNDVRQLIASGGGESNGS